MSNDEQQEELEVLQSIYPDELQILTPTSFRIRLSLDPPRVLGQTDDDYEPPTLLLHVSYPPGYPDEAPDLDVTMLDESGGSGGARLGEDEAQLWADDKTQLLEALDATAAENLGMAMVFSLASTLKDSAEGLIHARATQRDREREAALRREEAVEMEKFRGELVTRERFLAWNAAFAAEKAAARRRALDADADAGDARRAQRLTAKPDDRKLTGRQLWERGMAGNADADADADADAAN